MPQFVLNPNQRRLWVWAVDVETVGEWEVRSNRLVRSYLLNPQGLWEYRNGQPFTYFGGPPSRKIRRELVQLTPGDWGILTINGGPFPATVSVSMGWEGAG